MRQVSQILGQTGVAEYFSKLPVVAAADLEAAHESLAGAALRTHPLGGAIQNAIEFPAVILQFSDDLLVARSQWCVVAQFAFQGKQLVFPIFPPLLDHVLLLTGQAFFDVAGHPHDFVYDIHVTVVVNGDFRATPLRIGFAPEFYRRFQFSGFLKCPGA